MDLNPYLRKMAEQGASDLFITVGFPISAKINGQMTPISEDRLTEEAALALVQNVMSDKQRDEFDNSKECNFAIARDGIGRFRCSAFWQRDMVGMVVIS